MAGTGPSGWNIYYIVVLAGMMALLVPLALWAASWAFSPRRQSARKPSALVRSENPAEIGRKSNPRIFQALNASLILVLLALLMIPCVIALPGIYGLVSILSLSLIAGLALLYGVRKRDLEWLRSFKEMRDDARGARK